MTNREIAAALFIAHGTVRKHLDNVYAKLGVRSRAQAVAVTFGGSRSALTEGARAADVVRDRPTSRTWIAAWGQWPDPALDARPWRGCVSWSA